MDLKERLEKHNKGLVKSTEPYRPWKVIYYEAYLNKEDAKRRECYSKTAQGQRLLKRRLKDYFYDDNK
ncbi:MAG: GIY-YIG nuclease family protein [Patescibacteria group bacterium]|nr:GIY-YIG nuclease family protein [Patescibacteria group bacterium]MDD5172960.1 GIY-YIG nuclease family protein [Patescibacteria group bacterium]